ncbi:MAG: hypothetical protein ACYS3N_01730 [Planctomycetota bacterium]
MMAVIQKRKIRWIISLLFIICLLSVPTYAQYGGGTGGPNDPYLIATAEDLIALFFSTISI